MAREPLEHGRADSEGPANGAKDPLGPSAPQSGPTGEPRTPGHKAHSAGNIRDDQGTHAAGTVPASGDPRDAERDGGLDEDRPGDAG
ncbi:hypothetical protein LJ754_11850 [Arthrobacter sp. zg-Y40]|uniref:hypothetical protein n=1 Tax=Arthrobacter sp. zg-Y40 TaxID=2886939 RepID=UPI001D1452A9|nr:hypothetical protein [Arthrobacter sp. zg-Y40]MCC3279841.1 hypothetical protein [Arthrobacter sp. zg-Y40]